MKPEEKKAKELVEKFYGASVQVESIGNYGPAKECAILCVEEIIASNPRQPENNISVPLYWLEVIIAIRNI